MTHTTIEQELDAHGQCLFQTVGDSMEPILHNRFSTVVIAKPSRPLEKGDVVLFHRPPKAGKQPSKGAYVFHRIVKVRKKDFLICGDNRIYREPVPESWILGVMTGYYNGETYVDCTRDREYLAYVNSLEKSFCRRWIKALPGRVLGKLKRSLQ